MRLDTIIVARAAAATGDGDTSIIGAGVSRVEPQEFPWRERALVIVARFFLDDADLEREDTMLAVRILDPELRPLPETLTFHAAGRALRASLGQTVPGEIRLLSCIGDLRELTFMGPGLYHIAVLVNDKEVGRYPLAVIAGEATQPTPPSE